MPVWRHTREVIRQVLETRYGCHIGQEHLDDYDEDYYLVVTRGDRSAFLFVKEFEVVPAALMHVAKQLDIDFDELVAALNAVEPDESAV